MSNEFWNLNIIPPILFDKYASETFAIRQKIYEEEKNWQTPKKGKTDVTETPETLSYVSKHRGSREYIIPHKSNNAPEKVKNPSVEVNRFFQADGKCFLPWKIVKSLLSFGRRLGLTYPVYLINLLSFVVLEVFVGVRSRHKGWVLFRPKRAL